MIVIVVVVVIVMIGARPRILSMAEHLVYELYRTKPEKKSDCMHCGDQLAIRQAGYPFLCETNPLACEAIALCKPFPYISGGPGSNSFYRLCPIESNNNLEVTQFRIISFA